MGLFDKILGTSASANSATSISAAEQNITRSGDYYVTQSSVDLARHQRHALMNAVHTQSQDGRPEQPFDPDNPAWSESVSTIVDLWLAKFGDGWVEGSELENDIFFSIIATRLIKLNRLEKHHLPDRFYCVYRIVE
jgi:hypothetical protein